MDYDALAKQYGGADAAPVIDYDALAKQYGGADTAAPKKQESSGILGPIRGAIEAGAGLVTNVVTAPIVEGAKIYGALTSGKFGTPEGIRAGEEFGSQFQRNFYQPRTEEGQRYLQNIGKAASKTGMQGVPLPMLADLSRGVSAATRAAPLSEQVSTVAKMPFEKQIQAKRERLSAESYAKAPQLDAIAEAQRLKIALNPTDVENSISARAYSAAAGPRGPEALAKINQPRVTEIAKNELGIDSTTSLTSDSYKQARAKLAAPYDEVRKLPAMVADETIIKNLDDLRRNENLLGDKGAAKKVNKEIDKAIVNMRQGLTGADLLDSVRNLRAEAKQLYKNPSAKPKDIAAANANLAIANQLESMIESNITNPKLLDQFRDARQQMARSYVYEEATNFNSGQIDASKLARITAKDNALTGDIKSIGVIAGNNPDAFTTQVASKFFSAPRLTRSGLGGATGALIGSPFGVPGSIIGMAAGSVLGEFGGGLAAKRMASPKYQAGLTLQDYRIPTNQLAAAAAPIPQSQAVVPFDPRNALVQPNEIVGYAKDGSPITAAQAFSRPNFIMTRPGPEVRTGVQPTPPQLPAPSAQGTINTLRAEDVRRAGVSRTLGQQAEAQQAAAEAAARKPAGGEVILDVDPITGRMREASQGVKGATPETFRNLSSLDEAAKKVTAGKLFDLTAAEKVAWEKATVDIKDLGTGYNKLDDKAIAKKMMDREWVAEAYAKAREKAAMFDDIAKRAANEQTKFDAGVKRDQMLDLLSTLEDNLRKPRPTSSGAQGPKTREAIRNKLAGGENQNALSEEPFKVEIRGFNRE
jgi:hypothetical protein